MKRLWSEVGNGKEIWKPENHPGLSIWRQPWHRLHQCHIMSRFSYRCPVLASQHRPQQTPVHLKFGGKTLPFPQLDVLHPNHWDSLSETVWIYWRRFVWTMNRKYTLKVFWSQGYSQSQGLWLDLFGMAGVCFLQGVFIQFPGVPRTSSQKTSGGSSWFCNQLFHLYFINRS